MKLSVGQYIVDKLYKQGIEYVFGVPGSYVMPIWQSCTGETCPEAILARHESGAVFMAAGYARATKGLGVAVTTIGPGVTNAVTGLAEAYRESIPILLITGQAALDSFGSGVFQESSGIGRSFHPVKLLKNVTKFSYEIQPTDNIEAVLKKTYEIALSGRLGPVHLSIPVDIQNSVLKQLSAEVFWKVSHPNKSTNIFESVKQRISDAKRPLLIIGHGCYDVDASTLNGFCQKFRIPFVTTVKGLGAIGFHYEGFLGHIGPGQNKITISFIQNYSPDFVVAIGCSLSSYYTGAIIKQLKNAYLVQINCDEIDKNKILCDEFVNAYSQEFFEIFSTSDLDINITRNRNYTEVKKNLYKNPVQENAVCYMGSAIANLNTLLSDNTFVMPDAGNHWLNTFSLYKPKKPNSIYANTSLGCMGFAISYCIGLCFGNQKVTSESRYERIVCITGDGSLLMFGNEISVAAERNLPIIFIVFNNGTHGRIRIAQQLDFHNNIIGTDIGVVDFFGWAASIGAKSLLVNTIDEFDLAVENANEYQGTVVMDGRVDKDEERV